MKMLVMFKLGDQMLIFPASQLKKWCNAPRATPLKHHDWFDAKYCPSLQYGTNLWDFA
jgi:hypothetical protein